MQVYSQEFIADMKAVSQSGIVYNCLHVRVALPIAFVCDAPACAFLKCTKGHTGCYWCERCTQQRSGQMSEAINSTDSLPLK